MLYCFEEAVRIIEIYKEPPGASLKILPKEGTGYNCTEAPRGILFNRISLDDKGVIIGVKIVTPTAQNQDIIEDDLRKFIEKNLKMTDAELQWKCEQIIRNYDPTIMVKSAKNGFEAGDLLNSFKPDLVLLDVSMPGMNGVEVCRKIRKDKTKKYTAVVMITGLDDDEVETDSMEAGATEFLKKPFQIEELTGVFDRIIKV